VLRVTRLGEMIGPRMRTPDSRVLRHAILLAMLVLTLAIAPSASAVVYPVTKTADTEDGDCAPTDCSLREAVLEANASPATEDDISIPPGTYQLTLGQITITDAVTLDGADASLPHIVAAANSRVFNLTSQPVDDVIFQDLVVRGGNVASSGGGIANNVGSGSLFVFRSRVTGNTASPPLGSNAGGGGIYHGSSAAMGIEDSTIDANTANVSGTNNGGGGV
jgi:CSLREA domain-containing protein